MIFFIPRHRLEAGYYGIPLAVRMSVRVSVPRLSYVRPYFRFRMITGVNIKKFQTNLVHALILLRSDLGLLMSKFRHFFFTELFARDMSIFSFPNDHLNKNQWISTKFGLCIDIVEIWFRVAKRQNSTIFDGVFCPRHVRSFGSGR